MHGFKAHVQVEIKNKDGVVIKRIRKRLCKSYIRQMIDMLYCLGVSVDSALKDTSNASKTIDLGNSGTDGYIGKMDALATNDLYGVQVGTGVTTPNISDYALTTKILHGATSTKLMYGAVTLGAVAIVSTTAKFTVARSFQNDSGADINVKEVGLVVAFEDVAPALFYVLIEHSLLNFTIANGTSGTVTYTLSVTI